MTGLENVDPKLRRQYESAYGPYCAGDYQIDQQLRSATVTGVSSEMYHARGALCRKSQREPLWHVLFGYRYRIITISLLFLNCTVLHSATNHCCS